MAMILWIQVREESSQIVFPVFVHDKFFLHFLTNLSRVLAQAQGKSLCASIEAWRSFGFK
jgi:hypothetical protein